MKNYLLSLFRKNDWKTFQEFLKTEVGTLSDDEEVQFFKKASNMWKEAYLNAIWPSPKTEKYLMRSGSKELLKLLHDNWEFSDENLQWAFREASLETSKKVLCCLRVYPSEVVERTMLERKDTELLLAWVKKFKGLREEGERLINDTLGYQELRNVYINYMIQTQP